jgi:Ulp1 family protease
MQGTCLTSVPYRAALSREGRFHGIRCLRNGQWITTAIFDDLTPKLAAWLNDRSSLSWKIRLADTFQALEANKRSLRDTFVDNIRRDVERYDRVIFPRCFNRHWVILVTSKNKEEGTLASFNSKGVFSIDGARRILLKALKASPPAGPNLTTAWRCTTLRSVQQNNWTDCGVHALFNIIRLKYTVEHRPVPRLA